MMNFLTTFSKVLRVLLAILLLYFAFYLLVYHYKLIVFPYSNTFREAALESTTSLLTHGLNPYAFESQPQYANLYGIVYPLIVWPLASHWGVTLLVHRVVTAFFIFACCFFMFWVLLKKKVPFLLNVLAILMLYASLIYPATSTPCVDPAATGLFFMLLTIFIPYFGKYSYRSLVFSLVLGILAFYTKPYFVLGVPIMVSYVFLFISKKRAIFYGGLGCLMFVVSIFVMNKIFPSYFDNCFFVHSNSASEWESMERLVSQLKSYSYLHMGVLIFIIGFLINRLYRFIRLGQWQTLQDNILGFPKRIQWFVAESPLIKGFLSLEIWAGICTFLVLVLSLGKHGGATLWYFFQLLSPFLLMAVAQLAASMSLWIWIAAPLFILSLHLLTVDDSFDKQMDGWAEVQAIVNTNRHIFCSSLIAPLLLERNKEIFDSGQSEYFLYGAERRGFWGLLFQEDKRVYGAMSNYLNRIDQMIQHKEFELLIVCGYPSFLKKDVERFYRKAGAFPLYVPQERRSYFLEIWVPADK
ncbi:MAG: hypothetical protein HQL15_02215 [Candidatus Omnitrophica bacterium]|nr:hypothetical protein [Candidatus Omnitrophota bacterium]